MRTHSVASLGAGLPGSFPVAGRFAGGKGAFAAIGCVIGAGAGFFEAAAGVFAAFERVLAAAGAIGRAFGLGGDGGDDNVKSGLSSHISTGVIPTKCAMGRR